MKRLSIRARLTALTAILLAVCCAILFLFVMNSALMGMNDIEGGIIAIGETAGQEIQLNLTMGDLAPQLEAVVKESKQAFIVQGAVITALVVLGGSITTWLISGIILKPLSKLTEEIEHTNEENLSEPIQIPETEDEIRRVAVAFDRMRVRMDDAFRAQKQFTASAAHELRTPIAVMQTNLEVVDRKAAPEPSEMKAAIGVTLTQIDRVGKLVNSLLELLSMHTAQMNDRVVLPELVDEILCDLETVAQDKQIALSFEGEEVPVCTGNEVLLYRAISNLAENGIKYNRPGGSVKVSLKSIENDIAIDVLDTGKGIAKENWDKIFDPFYREDKSRSREMGGAGLGLALVSEIARIHGGRVYVESSTEQGTLIRMKIPMQQ